MKDGYIRYEIGVRLAGFPYAGASVVALISSLMKNKLKGMWWCKSCNELYQIVMNYIGTEMINIIIKKVRKTTNHILV